MKQGIVAILLLIASLQLKAQEASCTCSSVFEEMIQKLESNYIGLRHFFQQGKQQEYEHRKTNFSQKAQDLGIENCTELLQDFLSYFKDGHLFAFELPNYSDARKGQMAEILAPKRSVGEIEKMVVQQQSLKDPEMISLVGIYHDGSSRIALVKESEQFNAYILESSKDGIRSGELKASFKSTPTGLRGTYYSYSRVPRFMQPALYKDGTLLVMTSGVLWARLDTPLKRERAMVDLDRGVDQPMITKIDEDNVLFSIPSWAIDYQKFMSFLKENRETLLSAKTLIFDIRGNRGGNGIYLSFFDLFSDQNMPGGQGQVLASQDNLAYFERNMQFSKPIYKPVVQAIQKEMGQIVDGPQYPVRKSKRDKRSKIQNVAILTDNACMSAAESFILHAKQAGSIVRTFGSPTAGVIDYTSVNSLKLNSFDQNIYFGYPTSTLHKNIPEKGYNKTGIIPDVPIKSDVKDKVQYIIDYYKQGN